MGVFTSVWHPEDGRELQIKTGDDVCECYKVGDAVEWATSPHTGGYGTLLDGAYASYSDRGEDDWVIIKDHCIHAVVPCSEQVTEAVLREQFDIEEPDPGLWSLEAWIRRDAAQAEADRFMASIRGLPPEAQFGALLVRQGEQRRKMYEAVKEAFVVTPLPTKETSPVYMNNTRAQSMTIDVEHILGEFAYLVFSSGEEITVRLFSLPEGVTEGSVLELCLLDSEDRLQEAKDRVEG
jgi:hypothetical protein